MFSVIIPLYNKSTYIAKAIKSVLTQTYQKFELIVVNDGSTDNSLEVVQQFNNSTIQQFKILNQPNVGVSIARNNGINAAKYDYIAFLDADDWWDVHFLEEMNGLIKRYSNAGIYSSSYYIVKHSVNRNSNIGVSDGFNEGVINYFKVYSQTLTMPVWTSATVMKKNIFIEQNGFNPKLKLGEDFDLWVRIALKYPVVFMNKPLAFYNQDVELQHRAVGKKLYEPSEHMLFSNYGALNKNTDFVFLFERLSLYSLLPYYVSKKNKKEVDKVLSKINWRQHEFKYRLYYRILPKHVLNIWLRLFKIGSFIKNKIMYYNENKNNY